ncbi:hypothetical protein N9C22_01540 [Paracoccaceae bacterium]|nr:hypothetical protein [Paracoccaceae bacterium]
MQSINFISVYALKGQAAQSKKTSLQTPTFPVRPAFKLSGKPMALLCRARAQGLR